MCWRLASSLECATNGCTHSMPTIVRTNENKYLAIQYARLVVCCVTLYIPILCEDKKIQQILRTICACGGATELGHIDLERWEVYGWRQKGLYWRSYGVWDGAQERSSEYGALRVGMGRGQFECRVVWDELRKLQMEYCKEQSPKETVASQGCWHIRWSLFNKVWAAATVSGHLVIL